METMGFRWREGLKQRKIQRGGCVMVAISRTSSQRQRNAKPFDGTQILRWIFRRDGIGPNFLPWQGEAGEMRPRFRLQKVYSRFVDRSGELQSSSRVGPWGWLVKSNLSLNRTAERAPGYKSAELLYSASLIVHVVHVVDSASVT